jgi:queuine/archaeosine tRNA-ribosyltransferase
MAKKLFIPITKPTFFPSISNDKTSWFWKNNIQTEGLLISYDVLIKNKAFQDTKKTIKQLLGFNGFVIIDSGAFGEIKEQNPMTVYEKQKKLKPDIAILLDRITSSKDTKKTQRECIDITLKNANLISKKNKGEMILMAVVQGNNDEMITFCAKQLKNKFKVIGIPLSNFSKYKNYEMAIKKYLLIKKYFNKETIYHGLGCGSRTLIAILSFLGMRFFDSSSFYKTATYKEIIKGESFCSVKRPYSKKKCRQCLLKQRKPKSFQSIVNYNLREILKEIQRCRCALEKKQMKEYLTKIRLSGNTLQKIGYLLWQE